jgi:hypothetical protein
VGVTEEYNLFGPRNAAVVNNPLNLVHGKDFDDHVEAHESTSDTRPTGGTGASEHDGAADGTDDEFERATGSAPSGYDDNFGPSHDWQVAGD